MRRMKTIPHLYLIVAISLHLLWLISKTTKSPTTSEFLQLFRTSAKFFQSAFFAILYQALGDAPHSLCLAVASLIAFRHRLLSNSSAEMGVAESCTSVRLTKLQLRYFDRVASVHNERCNGVAESMEPAPLDSKRVEDRPQLVFHNVVG